MHRKTSPKAFCIILLVMLLLSTVPTFNIVRADLVNIYLESMEINGSTSNLGTIQFEPDPYPGSFLPSMIWREIAPFYQITYYPPSGHVIDHWELSGGIQIVPPNNLPYAPMISVKVIDPGTVRAIYKDVPPTIHLESRENDGSTSNLGTISFDSVSYTLPKDVSKSTGTYQATYYPISGYVIDHWEKSGGLEFVPPQADPYGGPMIYVQVVGSGTLRAIYKDVPPTTYDVTIIAHCNTDGCDINVEVKKDSESSGPTTPHTFAGLTGTHTFTVAATDSNGHPFKQWNTGEPSQTITVNSAGTFTAFYEQSAPIYSFTVKAHCSTEGTDIVVGATVDGSPCDTPYSFTSSTATHEFSVPSSDSHGHPFKQWNTGHATPTLTVNTEGTYTAYYESPPTPTYSVAIKAHCNTEKTDVTVSVWIDEQPGIYYTPYTFAGLMGTHTFTVSNYDTSSHPFKQWDTGSTSPSIIASSGGTYTAYYEAPQWTLTVSSAHDSPVPGNGPNHFSDGESVTCSVTSPVTEGSTSWTCTGWTGTGSVPSSGSGRSTGPFTITQDSTITWNWIVTPRSYSVSLSSRTMDGKVNLGSIQFAGQVFSLPSIISKNGGTYAATAVVPSGYGFDSWESSGSIVVFNPESQATNVQVSGDCTLKAVFKGTTVALRLDAVVIGNPILGGDATLRVTLENIGTTSISGGTYFFTAQFLDYYGEGGLDSFPVNYQGMLAGAASAQLGPDQHGVYDGVPTLAPGQQYQIDQLKFRVLDGQMPTLILTDTIFLTVTGFGGIQAIKEVKDVLVMPGPETICNVVKEVTIDIMTSHMNKALGTAIKLFLPIAEAEIRAAMEDYSNAIAAFNQGDIGRGAEYYARAWLHAILWTSISPVEQLEILKEAVWDIVGGPAAMSTANLILFWYNYKRVTYLKGFDFTTLSLLRALGSVFGLTLFTDPVNLWVTDPFGRHIGLNPTTGQIVNQIPDAVMCQSDGNVDGLYIPYLLGGKYDIILIGISDQQYSLHVEAFADSVPLSSQTFSGSILQNQVLASELNVIDSDFGMQATLTQPSPAHAISIESATLARTVVGAGYDVSFSYLSSDYGDYDEIFNVTLHANSSIIGDRSLTLTKGTNTVTEFVWNTAGVAYGNYTLRVCTTPVLGETALSDNNLTVGWVIVSIVGDISGSSGWPDSKVNIMDLAAAATLFRTDSSNPQYNINYDIDGDGIISIIDLSMVARHFGEHHP